MQPLCANFVYQGAVLSLKGSLRVFYTTRGSLGGLIHVAKVVILQQTMG